MNDSWLWIGILTALLVLAPPVQTDGSGKEPPPVGTEKGWEIAPLFGKVPPPVTLVIIGACLITLILWRSRHNNPRS